MKAIFFEQHGEIEVLKYASLPDPKPKPGEALIRVRAVALNYLDIWVRRGWKGLHVEMPHITGSDIAGEIVSVELPPGVTAPELSTGARVVVNPGVATVEDEWTRRGEDSLSPGYVMLGEHVRGGMAEYAIVPLSNIHRLPDEISFEEGAAPLLVGITCWRMLFRRADLKAGQSVLVVGAGGGVNSLAVVFARAAGAYVYSLAGSKEKAKKSLEIGAHEVIDYEQVSNWHAEVLKRTKGRGVDVVIDNVGQETFNKSLRAVTRGGKIITVGNTSGHEITFDNRVLFTKQISLIGSTMGSRQDFVDAINFMWRNRIKPVIDAVEPLSKGIQMIRRLEQGEHFGKIVLKP